jgi:hypothetical protein
MHNICIWIIEIPEERKSDAKQILKLIMTEKFPKLMTPNHRSRKLREHNFVQFFYFITDFFPTFSVNC